MSSVILGLRPTRTRHCTTYQSVASCVDSTRYISADLSNLLLPRPHLGGLLSSSAPLFASPHECVELGGRRVRVRRWPALPLIVVMGYDIRRRPYPQNFLVSSPAVLVVRLGTRPGTSALVMSRDDHVIPARTHTHELVPGGLRGEQVGYKTLGECQRGACYALVRTSMQAQAVP